MSTKNLISAKTDKKQTHKTEFGCLYAPVNGSHKAWILDWCRDVITCDMLFNDTTCSYGRETEPHCTILFGMKASPLKKIFQITKSLAPFWITLGPLHLFQNSIFDVIVAPVTSKEIITTHDCIKELTLNEEKYPYFPHLTIAYTKKNSAKSLVGRTDFMDTKILVDQFIYSHPKTGKKTTILLNKT